MTKQLFEPLKLANGTVIKNRLYKGAMSEGMAKNHRPTDELIRVYQRWAHGGIGMSLTGNVMVDSRYLGEPGNVVIEDDRDMDALKRWAQAGTENGSHIWMQINHPGKQSPKSLTKEPVAPSAIPISGTAGSGFNPPRAMTRDEIKDTIKRFVTTAEIAKEAGFTGVQIHGAHGYLVSQFLSPHDNQRTDEYGGNLENRMRFLVEIYQGMRDALGEQFPISLKINSTDFKEDSFTEDESTAVIKKMAELGMDLIEISGGDYEKPKMMSDGEVYFLDYAKKISREVDIPIAVIGGFRKKESMTEAIETTDVAMIGVARPLVLRPDLPNRLQNGTYNDIELPRLKTGIKVLDDNIGGFAGLTYYEQQISRLGQDLPPKKHTNAWLPLFHLVRTHGPAAISPRRR
ncbi:NADH:flavin oxidoreductase/NADH oxidase family protein [Macrococcus hajekii]|uniref:NADH:flavin oxidoreductase/NADH oxidase family protein n=1 Tax=Macrococcus hajekii TaxID=198482 RepID=A0A4V6PPN7_9STAP|nr:NADH:flavin oxidoreductase/NADH oxidase family protein [Macrococcus hajekii]TDM01764.1 NADH:flavin oxidoreductase/NADH oxidase family protein [Macrococcus hajekii]GGB07230.1 NADH oxidase [Macrococcus hajekii]